MEKRSGPQSRFGSFHSGWTLSFAKSWHPEASTCWKQQSDPPRPRELRVSTLGWTGLTVDALSPEGVRSSIFNPSPRTGAQSASDGDIGTCGLGKCNDLQIARVHMKKI
eukprot:scaffold11849_cov130-Isochrysis_galbana.AAC.4